MCSCKISYNLNVNFLSLESAEEDIYEDAEEDDFEYYEAGAGDAPYIISAGNRNSL